MSDSGPGAVAPNLRTETSVMIQKFVSLCSNLRTNFWI